jgi:branched-chain amino acid transport system permease protein
MSARGLLPVAVAVGLLASIPLGVSANTVLNFLVFTLIIAIAAQGWNILGGYGGQFSFGHAAFFGTGAYATAIMQVHLGLNAWIAFGTGIGAGAAVGLVIGFLSFRSGLRGSYFALITLAFAEVLRVLANASAVTGGAAGILIKLDVRPANFQFHSRAAFFWIALAIVAVVLLVTRWLEHSRFGAQLMAVRENEDAARALGVDALRVKLGAIALSAAVTAAAGGLYAQYFLYLDSAIAYGLWISVEALLAPIVGGIGTVFGPLIGALALHGLGNLTSLMAGRIPGIDLVVYGALLVLVVAFAPSGLLGLVKRLRIHLSRSGMAEPA